MDPHQQNSVQVSNLNYYTTQSTLKGIHTIYTKAQ